MDSLEDWHAEARAQGALLLIRLLEAGEAGEPVMARVTVEGQIFRLAVGDDVYVGWLEDLDDQLGRSQPRSRRPFRNWRLRSLLSRFVDRT